MNPLTDDQIDAMARLDGEQAADLTRLKLRHANELQALVDRHAQQREGLARRVGLPGAPGSTVLEEGVLPGSSGAAPAAPTFALRPVRGDSGGKG